MLSDVCNLNKYENLYIANRNDVHLIFLICSGGGVHFIENKTLGRALDPRANGTWLSKLTECNKK